MRQVKFAGRNAPCFHSYSSRDSTTRPLLPILYFPIVFFSYFLIKKNILVSKFDIFNAICLTYVSKLMFSKSKPYQYIYFTSINPCKTMGLFNAKDRWITFVKIKNTPQKDHGITFVINSVVIQMQKCELLSYQLRILLYLIFT
jgi:hypothetical protein